MVVFQPNIIWTLINHDRYLGCNGTIKHNQSAKNEPLYITQMIYISCNLPIYQYYCCVFIGMHVCMQ